MFLLLVLVCLSLRASSRAYTFLQCLCHRQSFPLLGRKFYAISFRHDYFAHVNERRCHCHAYGRVFHAQFYFLPTRDTIDWYDIPPRPFNVFIEMWRMIESSFMMRVSSMWNAVIIGYAWFWLLFILKSRLLHDDWSIYWVIICRIRWLENATAHMASSAQIYDIIYISFKQPASKY